MNYSDKIWYLESSNKPVSTNYIHMNVIAGRLSKNQMVSNDGRFFRPLSEWTELDPKNRVYRNNDRPKLILT